MADEEQAAPPPARAATSLEIASAAGNAQLSEAEAAALVGHPLSAEELQAYRDSALSTELKIRAAVVRLAIQGSSPAQAMALGFIEERRARERTRRRPG